MNIFVTNKCPIQSAKNLDNKRVVKMILESAQMLSTALELNGGSGPYKVTHKGHPCTKWVALNRSNYNWLLRHFKALSDEYTRRYPGKVHKSYREHYKSLEEAQEVIPEGKQTEFVNCARNKEKGVDYTDIQDIEIAYMLYLCNRWENDKIEPKWG